MADCVAQTYLENLNKNENIWALEVNSVTVWHTCDDGVDQNLPGECAVITRTELDLVLSDPILHFSLEHVRKMILILTRYLCSGSSEMKLFKTRLNSACISGTLATHDPTTGVRRCVYLQIGV